jgi:hypothetical protein
VIELGENSFLFDQCLDLAFWMFSGGHTLYALILENPNDCNLVMACLIDYIDYRLSTSARHATVVAHGSPVSVINTGTRLFTTIACGYLGQSASGSATTKRK